MPADWDRWGDLCRELTVHLRERYGADEVAGWEFEVWNEANLDVFWTGTQADYHRLYEVAVRAVKGVDARIRVGGPGSAAAQWVDALLEFCREHEVPVDFVSTHTYGNAPLDFRPRTRSFAQVTSRPEPEILWTEWGVTPTHFHRVNDSVFAAPFVLRGMKSALASTDALAHWVASDHFEEQGRPPKLFHGGFGLLTVGNLSKPRFWALFLLSRLAGGRVPAHVTGDGARHWSRRSRRVRKTRRSSTYWCGTAPSTRPRPTVRQRRPHGGGAGDRPGGGRVVRRLDVPGRRGPLQHPVRLERPGRRRLARRAAVGEAPRGGPAVGAIPAPDDRGRGRDGDPHGRPPDAGHPGPAADAELTPAPPAGGHTPARHHTAPSNETGKSPRRTALRRSWTV